MGARMSKLPNFLTRLMDPSQLSTVWGLLQSLPGGGRIMGNLIGRMAPYTGTIKAEVVTLEPGHSRVRMRDRPGLRNHLRSVHAIALMNLGEMTTGSAMLASLPPNTRGIPVQLSMEYLKKARGTITADCTCELIPTNEQREVDVVAELTDGDGAVVARMHARWRLGPAA
jgi:acyl-coenzyme A thioesterase PaaI-like protein